MSGYVVSSGVKSADAIIIPITFNTGLFVDVTFSGSGSTYAVFYAR
jgi:hypothetical protein